MGIMRLTYKYVHVHINNFYETVYLVSHMIWSKNKSLWCHGISRTVYVSFSFNFDNFDKKK